MVDRVARLPGAPCLLARGTRLGGVAFYHVNGSCRAIPANRGEMNHENRAARSDFFVVTICQCYLPNRMTVNLKRSTYIDESQAENRPVPVQEAEIRWKKKFPWSAVMFVVLRGRSIDNSCSPLIVSVR